MVFYYLNYIFNKFSTVGKDGVVLVWRFVDDYITENYQKLKKFQQMKPSKKLKLTETNAKTINKEDEGENDGEDSKIEEEDPYLSTFEKKCVKGRFILDKRQEMTSKNTAVLPKYLKKIYFFFLD